MTGFALFAALSASVASAAPTCEATCPPGTRIATFSENVLESSADGTFLWVESSCEATCAPIVPCRWPNVPVATQAGFSCDPVTGFSTLPPDASVDLGFGVNFDSELAKPPDGSGLGGRLEVEGSAFDAYNGLTVYMAAISGDQQTLHVVHPLVVSNGGFQVSLTGEVPADWFTLAFFIDEDADMDCGYPNNDTLHIMAVQAVATGVPPVKSLVWGALENASTNDALCPLVVGGLP